ncbi:MAG: hypothetical protein QOE11_1109 [Solirubrobacteraceae bacterium]|jgi:signal transduction histidine kinase|nr:hypothetical protein [Solirubrobacteraceae bacterium]
MGRRLRLTLGLVVAGLLAAMVVLGLVLVDSQSSGRRDLVNHFSERATASAALTESLFTSATAAARVDNSRRYGHPSVTAALLDSRAKAGGNLFLVLLSADGRIMGASSGASASVRAAIAAQPSYVRETLAGRPYTLSDVLSDAGKPTLVFTQGFDTASGRRALASGIDAAVLNSFLGGSLKQLPTVKGGRAYVLDSKGAIVASPDPAVHPGDAVAETGLLAAVNSRRRGSFGDDRYFVSDPIADTPWRVVLTAPQRELFASISGSHKWVPWLLLAGFGLAALIALLFVGRMLRSADKVVAVNAELARANDELEQRARQLAAANAELGRSNEELERFASIASHDLQEPLRKVQMFAERATQQGGEQLSEAGRDSLERMNDAARRMQALIDGLLVFSRITTKGRPAEDVALAQVAREVVDDLQAVIADCGATVEIGDLPRVPADPLQMRQLLQNLISNGLKFRREGVAPLIRVQGSVVGDEAEIAVIDNGIGFDPQYAARIFKVFERLHARTAYSGTGIGLALCRRIVERHEGTIRAESVPGEGSTFIVRLPLERAPGPPPQPAHDDREDDLVRS